MYFKRLELIGFKSFLNRTTFHFEPGITAIVGPNGCGKSNIFDAIKWVLGEQSVKELRGSKMEDVIFNGTDTKEPLGMAEVSLVLSNEDKKFPIDDKEVVISRRIFRSGECEYFLNHNPARLKDITDLILGTGLGLDSYSLIGQGKVDLIISSKPEERRIIFDEASGILKYKLQKKETTRKLEETESNLLRINDIISEVKRQINSLERQANKARRYKELFEELKEKERIFALFNLNKIDIEKNSWLEKLEAHTKKAVSLEEEYQKLLEENKNKEDKLKELEEENFRIKESILNIDNQIQQNNQIIDLNQQRIKELEEYKQRILLEIEKTNDKLKDAQLKIANFNKEFTELKEILNKKENLISRKEAYLEELNLFKQKSQNNIQQAKKEILELSSLDTKIKNQILDLESKLKVLELRKKRLNIERIKTDEDKKPISEQLENVKKELEIKEQEYRTSTYKLEEIENILKENIAKLDSYRAELLSLEKEKCALFSQKEFLENLKINYENIKDTLKTVILIDKLPFEEIDGLIVKIKEKLISEEQDKKLFKDTKFKLFADAKPFHFDTQDINLRLENIGNEIELKNKVISEKTKEIELDNTNIEDYRQKIHNLELIIADKKKEFDILQSQLEKLNEEQQIIDSELSDVEEEIDEIEEKSSCLEEEQSKILSKYKENEELIQKETENISSKDLEIQNCLLEITRIKAERDSLKDNLTKEEKTLTSLELNLKEINSYFKELDNQLNSSEEKITSLRIDIERLMDSSSNLLKEKQLKLKEQESSSLKIEQFRKSMTGLVESLGVYQQNIQDLNNQINGIKMKIQELEFKSLNIKERLKQLYNLEIGEFKELNNIEPDNLALEINQLKEKLDSFGSVNLVAIEEYDELKKRFDFLNHQQQDLLKAKESLQEAIQKINRTAKKLFLDTFKNVAEEFKIYFRLLFGGGNASLFLIDETDPLESGIEIVAQPPGKKLQNISLLSGGEKALAAIALIFAILKVKPSAFCILDEVDAALDEANVSRYANLLDEFSKVTQFIVITHNKRTLLNADVMYGITMEETGVSKVVSVKFSEKRLDSKSSAEPVLA
ncbi:MAG: AAA family ATPase [Candidatus Omnitrophica bacterium]|nr:AAA family ATPase [Candidatus Omnitrophota bacterium]